MPRTFLRTAAVATVALLCASGALAARGRHAKPPARTTVKLMAALNIGQEVPHPKGTKAGASGRFTATLSGTTLKWTLTFAHLSGPATAAHVHIGARGKSGPVAIPLCGPCTSPASGTATATSAQVKALLSGGAYVNVHTAANPGGEIRGQITKAA